MIFMVTFLSFLAAALVIETRFAFLKPEEVSPRKKFEIFLVKASKIAQKQAKLEQK